jgi:hypothetical protein
VAVAVAVAVAVLVGTSVALARGGQDEPETLPTAMTSVGPQLTTPAIAQPSSQTSRDSAKPPAPQAFQATAQILQNVCPDGYHYALDIRVSANAPLTQAILLWQIGSGPVYWDDMSIAPSKMEADGHAGGLSSQPLKWWVKASGVNGSTAHSATVTSANPCA